MLNSAPHLLMDLLAAARAAQLQAHTPYCHFKVGAAVLTSDGQIYAGCNFQTSTWDDSLCAERVAIANAVAQGAAVTDRHFIRAVAVSMAEPATPETLHLCSPCGACRQVINDFAISARTDIVLDDGHHGVHIKHDGLLPHAFVLGDMGDAQPMDCAEIEQTTTPETIAEMAQKIALQSANHVTLRQSGAVLITRSGRAYAAAMVENSCNPLTISPLQAAIGRAIVAGEAQSSPDFITHVGLYLPARAATPEADFAAAIGAAVAQEFMARGCVITLLHQQGARRQRIL